MAVLEDILQGVRSTRPKMVHNLVTALLAVAVSAACVPQAALAAAPPVITVWYSNAQTFGTMGIPQRYVNIVGNVYDPAGVASLSYTLNGGGSIPLSMGPDTRRLMYAGDFNIDIRYRDLDFGVNVVTITARSNIGEISSSSIAVVNQNTGQWPRNYSVQWTSPRSLMDSSQVVDGRWGTSSSGLRLLEPGYDRLIAIGDTTWDDYEVTAQITVNGIDSTYQAFGAVSGGPGLGFLFRWSGHSNNPTFDPPITQPKSGFIPYGGIAWYHWKGGFGNGLTNRWELLTNNLVQRSESSSPQIVYGIPYYFKMRVKTTGTPNALYSFKVWQKSQPEPSGWLMTGADVAGDPTRGSFMILAHEVDATITALNVEPLGDVTTPVLVGPADNATNQNATPTLIWRRVDRAGTYRVQVSTTSGFTSGIALDDPAVEDTFRVVAGLQPGTPYYWRVSAANPDAQSDFSVTRTFATQTSTPVLASPVNNAVGLSTNLTLRWYRVPTATQYTLQVATDSTFASGVVLDDSNITDTTRTVSNLSNSKKYFWRIRAQSPGGASTFSTTWNFKTVLPPPALVAPDPGIKNQQLTVTLRWRKVSGATTYFVQVASDSTFGSGIVVVDSTLTDTSRVVTGLAYATTYFWRVRSRNTEGTSPVSVIWNLSTSLPPPTLVSPVNNALDQLFDLVLKWRKIAGAVTYRVQVSTEPSFTSGLFLNDVSVTDTTRALTGLQKSMLYYWKVSASNSGGEGPFSSTWNFTTKVPSPVLLSPANGIQIDPVLVTLQWSSVDKAVRYRLQVARDSLFTQLIKNDTTLTDTLRSIIGLAGATMHYWRVQAITISGASPFTAFWRFRTVGDIPGAVSLMLPGFDSVIAQDSVKCVWRTATPGAAKYWFELSVDSLFVLRSVDSTADTTYMVRRLLSDHTYWWKVRAGSSEGWGPFSETRRFSAKLTDVASGDLQGIPSEWTLGQNYPNPFNPSTVIAFGLPHETNVRLDVFNTLGEFIETLVNERMDAGYHTVRFDASGRASGIYFYRFQTPEKSFVKRMLLLR